MQNAKNLMILTPAEKIIKEAKLKDKFPVSTGLWFMDLLNVKSYHFYVRSFCKHIIHIK